MMARALFSIAALVLALTLPGCAGMSNGGGGISPRAKRICTITEIKAGIVRKVDLCQGQRP